MLSLGVNLCEVTWTPNLGNFIQEHKEKLVQKFALSIYQPKLTQTRLIYGIWTTHFFVREPKTQPKREEPSAREYSKRTIELMWEPKTQLSKEETHARDY